MPLNAGTIRFIPLTAEHYPLLKGWLEQPHWIEWWGPAEEEFGYVRDMVEGRDTTRPFIFEMDGRPVGYIQYWFIGHHQNDSWIEAHPWLRALPAETVGVDLSIGEKSDLSRGIGSTVLAAFVKKLQAEGYDRIIIDPEPKNRRAIRAYEKAGFLPVPGLEGLSKDALIMQFVESKNEKTS